MSIPNHRVESALRELASLDEDLQHQRLEALSHSDPELHRHVEAMLHDRTVALNEPQTLTAPETEQAKVSGSTQPGDDLVGSSIGKISILQELGQGGMGTVYAGYDEKLKRRVAIKCIRRHHALSEEIKARFLQEAQILSRLQHPNICQIHDYIEGDDADFLVLELIEGKTLKELDRQSYDHSARMRLAIQMADVLAAAHAQGVIHRDLKPANVMVTTDGQGHRQAKLLDFGIARSIDSSARTSDAAAKPRLDPLATADPPPINDPMALEDGDTLAFDTAPAEPITHAADATRLVEDSSVKTQTGSMIGTPQYMSPEQAAGATVTPASDMYSFGLLLQEFLTDKPPYRPGLNPWQLLIAVQKAETQPVVGLEPKLTSVLEQLKALEPGARPSAHDAAEMLRAIRDAPRLRRERRLKIAGVALLALIAAVMTFQAFRIQQEATRATAAAAEARSEAETAQQVESFLLSLFTASDPWRQQDWQARGDEVTVREILDRGVERLDDELADQPEIRARLLNNIGQIHARMGLYDSAQPLLEEGLAIRRQSEDPLDISASLARLGNLAQQTGRYDEAEKYLVEALELREKNLSPDHPSVAESLVGLGFLYGERSRLDEAEKLLQRAVDIREGQPADAQAELAAALHRLALIFDQQGRLEEAEVLLRRTVEIRTQLHGVDHPTVGSALNALGIALDQQRKVEEALEAFGRGLEISSQSLGPDHAVTGNMHMNLGNARKSANDFEGALEAYGQATAIFEKALGPDHPRLAEARGNTGIVALVQGDFEHARRSILATNAIFAKAFGERHPSMAIGHATLADIAMGQRRFDSALISARLAHDIFAEALGAEHPQLAKSKNLVARVLIRLDRPADALQEIDAMWKIVEASLPPDHVDRTGFGLTTASLERVCGELDLAQERLDATYALAQTHEHLELMMARLEHEQANVARDRALELYEQSARGLEAERGLDHPSWIRLLEDQATTLRLAGRDREAAVAESRVRQLAERFEVDL